MLLEEGVLFVLPRDEAKMFFGFRQDEPRLQYVRELIENDTIVKSSCAGKWQALHDHLVNVELDQSFLGQAILDGRAVHQGDDHHVILVRPDVVAFIDQQFQRLAMDRFGNLTPLVQQVAGIYQQAAATRDAVVFAAKRQF